MSWKEEQERWNLLMGGLAFGLAAKFEEDNFLFVRCLNNYPSQLNTFGFIYHWLTTRMDVPKLEDIEDAATKERVSNTAVDWCDDVLNKRKLKQFYRAVWCLDFLIKQ